MSCCLAGADDTADVFVWHDGYDEQDLSAIHAQALNSLLAIVEPAIENFDLARIFESPCSGRETDTMLREICRRFDLVPFEWSGVPCPGLARPKRFELLARGFRRLMYNFILMRKIWNVFLHREPI
jgi:hypothetical protein